MISIKVHPDRVSIRVPDRGCDAPNRSFERGSQCVDGHICPPPAQAMNETVSRPGRVVASVVPGRPCQFLAFVSRAAGPVACVIRRRPASVFDGGPPTRDVVAVPRMSVTRPAVDDARFAVDEYPLGR